MIPGIWKLTTDSLPYELDIRSKLDKRFSRVNNNISDHDEILLKLNEDGTFKQCDEGYREGRWVTGRWKLQLTTDIDEDRDEYKSENMLLLLAINRQYFGPSYDVLLKASICNSNSTSDSTSNSATNGCDDENENVGQRQRRLQESLKTWRGVVQKGTFIRPSPGKHPFDLVELSLSSDQSSQKNNSSNSSILADPESLGPFSLEQALTSSSIDRSVSQRRNVDNDGDSLQSVVTNEMEENNHEGDNNDDLFFTPYSSSDDGAFQ